MQGKNSSSTNVVKNNQGTNGKTNMPIAIQKHHEAVHDNVCGKHILDNFHANLFSNSDNITCVSYVSTQNLAQILLLIVKQDSRLTQK